MEEKKQNQSISAFEPRRSPGTTSRSAGQEASFESSSSSESTGALTSGETVSVGDVSVKSIMRVDCTECSYRPNSHILIKTNHYQMKCIRYSNTVLYLESKKTYTVSLYVAATARYRFSHNTLLIVSLRYSKYISPCHLISKRSCSMIRTLRDSAASKS